MKSKRTETRQSKAPRARSPRSVSPLSRTEAAVNSLLDAGNYVLALKLSSAAAARFPASPVLAKILEKAVCCTQPQAAPGTVYAGILKQPGACPEHFYHLGMFFKRAGDYAGLSRAFYGFLRSEGAKDPIQEYIVCCSLDEYGAAFRAAERILDAPDYGSVLSRLWNPWGDRSSAAPDAFFAARMNGLNKARVPAGLEHYRTFMRGALFFYAGERARAMREFGSLPELPAARYGWMRFPAGWASLYGCDYTRALREFTAAAECPVSRTPARGRMAEVYICTGRRAAGFREFTRAIRSAPLWAAAGLNSWEGQMRLFTGDYRRALHRLTAGAEMGDDAAFCWRGAAYSKLGRSAEALADLDKAVRLFPTDKEARVWRGEVLRLAGRPADAVADLDLALRAAPHDWAYINRALARRDLGDLPGMRRDYSRTGADIRKFLESRPAGSGLRGTARIAAMLEEGLRLALGNRRDDRYFNPLWMRG